MRRRSRPLGRVHLKKKVHQICFEGGAELEAIANAALDSVAKDGIGCTAQLEHAMDKAATGICRKLLSATLQSEAAKAKCSPKPGERNAGTKSIDVVSMFGPVGTISRTYYYDREKRRGHYPRDEQMGLERCMPQVEVAGDEESPQALQG